MRLGLLIYVLVSVLLIWAGVRDLKTGSLPRLTTFGLLGLALLWLCLQSLWWEAAFFVLAVLSPVKGIKDIVPILAGIGLLAIRSLDATTMIFVLTVLGARFLASIKVFGGGDAQLMVALSALTRSLSFLVVLAAVYVLVVLILSLIRFGFVGSMRRMPVVAKNLLNKTVESDNEKIRTPWAATAALSGMLYLWVIPGAALAGLL